MKTSSRIYVAGHSGLLGSAIVKQLRKLEYSDLILRSHRELDLTDQEAVRRFFAETEPEYVFLAAARVGGILANSSRPADFILDNLLIAINVIREAYRVGVERLLFLGSSCIYPRMAPQPMKESVWLTGPLEETNRPYAIAKIAGIELCSALNRQFGTSYVALMPTNLYGPNDNYDVSESHLIPALIRKFHEAKVTGATEVVLWGTGTPKREILYSEDAANACVFLMNLPDDDFGAIASTEPPMINAGSGSEMTISDIAESIKKVMGVNVTLRFDHTKPDGTPRKLIDSTRLNALGWKPTTPMHEGILLTYQDFLNSHSKSVISEWMANSSAQ